MNKTFYLVHEHFCLSCQQWCLFDNKGYNPHDPALLTFFALIKRTLAAEASRCAFNVCVLCSIPEILLCVFAWYCN